MDDLTLSVIVATAVFVSGVIGLSLHRFLDDPDKKVLNVNGCSEREETSASHHLAH